MIAQTEAKRCSGNELVANDTGTVRLRHSWHNYGDMKRFARVHEEGRQEKSRLDGGVIVG